MRAFTFYRSNTGTEFNRNPFSIFRTNVFVSCTENIIMLCKTVMLWFASRAPCECALRRVTMAKGVQACHILQFTCVWHADCVIGLNPLWSLLWKYFLFNALRYPEDQCFQRYSTFQSKHNIFTMRNSYVFRLYSIAIIRLCTRIKRKHNCMVSGLKTLQILLCKST
jgi:hypothetical protein